MTKYLVLFYRFKYFTHNFFIRHFLWRKWNVSFTLLCLQVMKILFPSNILVRFWSEPQHSLFYKITGVYYCQYLTFDLLTSHNQHRQLYRNTKFGSLFQLHVGIRLQVDTINGQTNRKYRRTPLNQLNHLATGGESQRWSDMTLSKNFYLRVI